MTCMYSAPFVIKLPKVQSLSLRQYLARTKWAHSNYRFDSADRKYVFFNRLIFSCELRKLKIMFVKK